MCEDMRGPECATCPVNRFGCDAPYMGYSCSVLRAKEEEGFDPETNLERISHMCADDMRKALIEYFSDWADIGDSYIFDLTRIKSAFAIGTMSFDDFVEWDEDRIAELVNELLAWLQSPVEAIHDV